jgi:transposase
VPARLKVNVYIRPKHADPKHEERGVVIAPMPDRPIDKGIAEAGLLASVVVEKYADHLPLYRQAQRFSRQGVTIPESTLGDWVAGVGILLEPLAAALRREVFESGYVQADETPIAVQDRTKKGTTHQGYFWLYHSPPKGLVYVDYQRGRGGEGLAAWLKGYSGALQSDRYGVYLRYDGAPGITGYACWAHARRYFFEAQSNDRDRAKHALGVIQTLYEIERAAREAEASPDDRQALRRQHATNVLERFKAWLRENPGTPKSPWGKAVNYVLGHWEALTRYVDNGLIEIDNNLVENAVRPIALGRKNYLFQGSHEAAGRAAGIYSLLATCKQHGVNPYEWLRDILMKVKTHSGDQLDELLPHSWQAVPREEAS